MPVITTDLERIWDAALKCAPRFSLEEQRPRTALYRALAAGRPRPATTLGSFCHHVFFLASAEAGARSIARRGGAFLLTLDQAFELGRRMNAARSSAAAGAP